MKRSDHVVIDISRGKAYVVLTEASHHLEAILDAITTIRRQTKINKFYFDCILLKLDPLVSVGNRFQYAQVDEDIISVYNLSYLHNEMLRDKFNPIIDSFGKNRDTSIAKLDRRTTLLDGLDESVPYAKIRLI